MPSITSPLYRLNLVGMSNLLERAHAKTTFWGSRIVEISGNRGSIGLYDLAEQILNAGEQRREANDLTLQERRAGLAVVHKLRAFENATDTEIATRNCFIRFLDWMSKLFSTIAYNARFFITDCKAIDNFCAYSEEAFIDLFEGVFGVDHAHPDAANSGGFPLRIIAKETSIQRL